MNVFATELRLKVFYIFFSIEFQLASLCVLKEIEKLFILGQCWIDNYSLQTVYYVK